MKKRKHGGLAGKLLTLFLLAAGAGLLYYVYRMNIVPMKYVILAAAAAVVLVGLVGFLTWNFNKRGRFVIGLFLWFAVLMVFAVGFMYVQQTHSTMKEITSSEKEVSQIGVFVRTDNTASSIPETSGMTYGVLRELDRGNTDAALQKVEAETGAVPTVAEYEGLTELVDSITKEETGAIILNEAYLDVIRELEGYEALDSMIKEVGAESVETELRRAETNYSYTAPSTDGTASTALDMANSPAQENIPETDNNDVYVVYVSGIDSRTGLVAKSRSDVNIVAVANMKTKQALLINTPRDFFVPLSISNGAPDKLTHAGIYGINVSMDTLAMLYQVKIPYYVKVNFQGFINIIDALGGIDVYSDYTFDSKNELGWHYDQGMNHLDGEAALTYSRERFSFADGDRQRGKNQMAVIEAMMDKMASTDLLTNYTAVMKGLEGSFETNFTLDEISRLIQKEVDNPGEWNVVTYSVNGTGDTQKPYSLSSPAYVMVPDQSTVDTARALIQDVIKGVTLQQVDEEIQPLLSEEEAMAIFMEENKLNITPTPGAEGTDAAGAAAPAGTDTGAAAAPAATDAAAAAAASAAADAGTAAPAGTDTGTSIVPAT